MKSFGGSTVCELCHHHQASFYCCSDSAFLCSIAILKFTPPTSLLLVTSAYLSVNHHHRRHHSSSSSSSSSTTSKSHKANNKAKMGLGVNSSLEVIEVAIRAFEASWGVVVWPYRLLLAASLWLGVMTTMFTKKDDDDDKKNKIRISLLVKRLQEISGVPANSIMLAQSKLLLKMMKHQHQHHQQQHLEEGWDETT
ncbi:hypothetical protein OSB04_004758 [Centaurea solstitialis]|uniref:Uncharacterized protein n=1 Tax=Centaurea solstitialis TaxID=347529 RepID=A0AA38TZC9_9ASTR|nr:hypothetical protein OSB04_004758 [Centaurea solstitialis]